nr:class I SAM-dependent methyltransferase [Allomuricauda sp.]
MSVLLQKPTFEGISQKELAQQLEGLKKSKSKLPTWYNLPGIYYPKKVHLEQTSSERTAAYKSKLLSGKSVVDISGGFGVDSYYFSKRMEQVLHCEWNAELCQIAAHNFAILGCKNVQSIAKDGMEVLEESPSHWDWIYVDPSRRHDQKGKVFLLADCQPNIPNELPKLFGKAQNILIKTSPILDIRQGIKELRSVKEVHVVAVENEVKELLFVLKKDYDGPVGIKTVNLTKGQNIAFDFDLEEEKNTVAQFGDPDTFLYEPNAAILKSGGFKKVGVTYNLNKLLEHTHLYTSDQLVDFPGRRFNILKVLPYSKSSIKSEGIKQANVATRNFPLSVAEIRKKHKLKDGGEIYLFFTKTLGGQLTMLLCRKLS